VLHVEQEDGRKSNVRQRRRNHHQSSSQSEGLPVNHSSLLQQYRERLNSLFSKQTQSSV
jgi:hypothetical protein